LKRDIFSASPISTRRFACWLETPAATADERYTMLNEWIRREKEEHVYFEL
jgi:hypothetical protein